MTHRTAAVSSISVLLALDETTRTSPGVVLLRSAVEMSSVDALDRLHERCGCPRRLCLDTSFGMVPGLMDWSRKRDVRLFFYPSMMPESRAIFFEFAEKLANDFLEPNRITSVAGLNEACDAWRREYNCRVA